MTRQQVDFDFDGEGTIDSTSAMVSTYSRKQLTTQVFETDHGADGVVDSRTVVTGLFR